MPIDTCLNFGHGEWKYCVFPQCLYHAANLAVSKRWRKQIPLFKFHWNISFACYEGKVSDFSTEKSQSRSNFCILISCLLVTSIFFELHTIIIGANQLLNIALLNYTVGYFFETKNPNTIRGNLRWSLITDVLRTIVRAAVNMFLWKRHVDL